MKIIEKLMIVFLMLLSFCAMAQLDVKLGANILGTWEYETVIIGQDTLVASSLNECGIRDVLRLQEGGKLVRYQFGQVVIKGNQIGVSNENICVVHPETYEFSVTDNSCKTYWIRLLGDLNRIVCVASDVVVEYVIQFQNSELMVLVKVREIVNDGGIQPSRIELKRIR